MSWCKISVINWREELISIISAVQFWKFLHLWKELGPKSCERKRKEIPSRASFLVDLFIAKKQKILLKYQTGRFKLTCLLQLYLQLQVLDIDREYQTLGKCENQSPRILIIWTWSFSGSLARVGAKTALPSFRLSSFIHLRLYIFLKSTVELRRNEWKMAE